MAGGRSTRPAVISKSHFNSDVSNCMRHHTLRCRATKLCQGGCMTRISHADFPLPSFAHSAPSAVNLFGSGFRYYVPLRVPCTTIRENLFLLRRFSPVPAGTGFSVFFSVSPCLRGGFAFCKGVIEK